MENENSGKSVLETVIAEREAEYNYYDSIIADPSEFLGLLIAVLPDEQIIRFYDYLVKRQRKLEGSFDEEATKTVEYANVMTLIMKLEEIAVIDEHKKEQEQAQADKVTEEIVKKIEERRKVKKMGPIRRAIYNFRNNR